MNTVQNYLEISKMPWYKSAGSLHGDEISPRAVKYFRINALVRGINRLLVIEEEWYNGFHARQMIPLAEFISTKTLHQKKVVICTKSKMCEFTFANDEDAFNFQVDVETNVYYGRRAC